MKTKKMSELSNTSNHGNVLAPISGGLGISNVLSRYYYFHLTPGERTTVGRTPLVLFLQYASSTHQISIYNVHKDGSFRIAGPAIADPCVIVEDGTCYIENIASSNRTFNFIALRMAP